MALASVAALFNILFLPVPVASIVVVIIAQLMPQIISALYPVQCLELALMRHGAFDTVQN